MDAVTFHGREYIKATTLALKYRYTQDYLGQLARAKKVDARLVGRAWYVNEESLLIHRGGKYKTSNNDEISDTKAIDTNVSRIDVQPYLKNKTARLVLGNSGDQASTKVLYQDDNRSLMPRVKKDINPLRLQVEIADSERVKITTLNKKPTNFKSEELPEVALSGTLEILDISETEENNVIPEEKPVPTSPLSKKTVVVRPRPKLAPRKQPIPPVPTATAVRTASPATFIPANIPEARMKVQEPTRGSLLVPTLAVFTAFMVSFGLLATNLEISAKGSEYDSRLNVALSNIFLLLP